MTYYAFIQNNKINGGGECRCLNSDILNIEITEEQFNNIQDYIWNGEAVILDPELDAKKLAKAKEEKTAEALELAYDYQQNGTVEYKNCVFEMGKENRDNLRDTAEALDLIGQASTTWNDKDDNFVELTIEDIQHIRLNLILGEIQKIWIVKYPAYLSQIEQSATVEEVENIVIDYSEEI